MNTKKESNYKQRIFIADIDAFNCKKKRRKTITVGTLHINRKSTDETQDTSILEEV